MPMCLKGVALRRLLQRSLFEASAFDCQRLQCAGSAFFCGDGDCHDTARSGFSIFGASKGFNDQWLICVKLRLYEALYHTVPQTVLIAVLAASHLASGQAQTRERGTPTVDCTAMHRWQRRHHSGPMAQRGMQQGQWGSALTCARGALGRGRPWMKGVGPTPWPTPGGHRPPGGLGRAR